MGGEEIVKSNEEIVKLLREQGKYMEQMLAGQMAFMGLNDRGLLLKKMRYSIKTNLGSPEALRFGVTRYGMIKLHGIKTGTTYTTRSGRKVTLSQKKAQDWWTPVANRQLPIIADKVAALRADMIMRQSKFLNFDGRKIVYQGYKFPTS